MAAGMAGRPMAYMAGSAAAVEPEANTGERRTGLRLGRTRIGRAVCWLARAWFQGWVLYVAAMHPREEAER